VAVGDGGFSPQLVQIPQGTGVMWTNNGAGSHTATDSSGMGLFDSGTLDVGAAYTFYFIGAGTYAYQDAMNPTLTGSVRVPVIAQPPTGDLTTTFTITWAADQAPTDYSFDIQIKRPGATKWRPWLTDQDVVSSTFVADRGVGTYQFRARSHNELLGFGSGWSKAASIAVS
jgi:hypothetical protein